MSRHEIRTFGEISLVGISTKIGSNTHLVLARDVSGKILLATTTLADPTAETGAGFAKGCMLIKTDAAGGTKSIYENQGTTTTASFNLMGDITTAEIGTSAVTSAKIATSAVLTTRIGDAAVTAGKIGTGAVVTTSLGTSKVTSAKIATSAVLTTRIGDSAVTAGKIGTGAVVTTSLGTGKVTSAKIATSAVLATRIGDAAITVNKLGAASVSASKLKIATKSVVVASAGTSALSAVDLTCSAGTIIGFYPTSNLGTSSANVKTVSIASSGQAKVLMGAAVNHAATYAVVIAKA